jgi:hypothetical protein
VAAVVAELGVPVAVTVFVKSVGFAEPVGAGELVSAPAVLVAGTVVPAELMAAVWAASVEPPLIALAEPEDGAGTGSVELMGLVTAPCALPAGAPAVTVAFAAGLVDVGGGALVRSAVLVEPELGLAKPVDELVSTVAAC